RPNRVANDRAWETETFKARKIRQIQHGIALQRQVDGNNLTMPLYAKFVERGIVLDLADV
ncbi:hypothetical protein, partial [Celeribacter sp. PS-C1]|uniref:hypothetical protein n=1 Tax=Celeribacter sp. PS-C1 TaxID=2820813 RepID=UPI001CA5C1B0